MVKYRRVIRWGGSTWVICLQPEGWGTTLCGHQWDLTHNSNSCSDDAQCPLCKKIMMEDMTNVKGNNADSAGEDGSTG